MKKLSLILLTALLMLSLGACSNQDKPEPTVEPTVQPTVDTGLIEPTPEATAPAFEEFDNQTGIADLKTWKADMSGYVLLQNPNPPFVEISFRESMRFLEEGGSGAIYFGYPGCSFCNQAIMSLDDAALATETTIYYVNVSGDFEYTQADYEKMIGLLEDILEVDEAGEPTMYVPYLLGIKDGEVVGNHISLVDSYDMSSGKNMDAQQRAELANIYIEIIEKTK